MGLHYTKAVWVSNDRQDGYWHRREGRSPAGDDGGGLCRRERKDADAIMTRDVEGCALLLLLLCLGVLWMP